MSIADAFDAHDATGLAALVAGGDVSPTELLDEALSRVDARNPALNAIASLNEGAARRMISEGLPDGPFKGVPFLLKDIGAEAVDFPVSSGSALLKGAPCPGDSRFYEKLRAAGLVTFGRTTSPEFGVGPATEAAVYGGPTRNPWNTDHTSGGSSGGAAAVVAGGILPVAHASDGAGSIRIPAASCGLYGIKPTRGRVSMAPFAGEGWGGMSTAGFVTRTVRDQAALMDLVMGPELGDPYAAPPLPMSFSEAAKTDPGKLRIGILTTTFTGDPIHPECVKAVEDAAALLKDLGHEVFEAPLPDADTPTAMRALMDIISCGTALKLRSVAAARGREIEQGEVERIAFASRRHAETIDGAAYLGAINIVHAYGRALARWMSGMDVLVTTTLSQPPAEVGRFSHDRDDFLEFRLGPNGVLEYSPYCAAFNSSGQPAVSVPLHWTPDGLPVGVHLAAPYGEDCRLVSLSAQLETAKPWADKRAPLANFT
ncbi:MAG: 6-aminohexanoate hydrolase [Rhodobacteraceae bacterium]|nr:6-aminohexanoate hydrolase [Paracoccaceae bacterium]